MAELTVFVGLTVVGCLLGVFLLKYRRQETVFPEAYISKTLCPLIDHHIHGKTVLRITGHDGYSIPKENYDWLTYMEIWLKRGCHISYLLFDPSDDAVSKLKELACSHSKQLTIYHVPAEKKAANAKEQQLLEDLRTFHFLLAENPRFIWLERYHPSNSTTAYDCELVHPGPAEVDPRFASLLSKWDLVTERYAEHLT